MLNYGSIRDLYKNTDRINSQHQVIAEWNMNKYIPIKQYGTYRGFPGSVPPAPLISIVPSTYNENDTQILSGQNYFIYSDGTTKADPSHEFFSDLASVFKPNRPDPGIILLQYNKGLVTTDATNLKIAKIATNNPRYYPVTKNRPYDYFNSAKVLDVLPQTTLYEFFFDPYQGAGRGISDPKTGKIAHTNPFVVYKSDVKTNKIVIKVQTHLAVPQKFAVDILIGTNWTTIYSSIDSADFSTGILNLYYNGTGWTKTINRVTDLNQLDLVSPTQLINIRGLRLKVEKMTIVNDQKSPASLELIEISPRLEIDVTEYVETFNFSSSLGDSTSFGLPVGSIVSGNGSLILSNEDNKFILSSTLGKSKMLNQDVKFSFYQKVYVPNDDNTYTIPMKILYSNEWSVQQDFSVQVALEDGMKYLRQTMAPDILFSSNVPLSVLILILLDNIGVTGLEFKKSSDANKYDKEDTRIKNFFCKKEQTVAEVLEQIAIATQCSMFYDASGKLNVLTKERLSENAAIAQSTGPGDSIQKTDFWFVGDEDYSVIDDPEYSYINGYNSNIISIEESKINPITDGDITYHNYGPRKTPLSQTINPNQKKTLDKLNIDQIPMAGLAFSNYGYSLTPLWEPAQDDSSVLGVANVNQTITDNRLKDIFTDEYTALDEDNLIRKLYVLANDPSEFPTEEARSSARRSLIIYLDTNEGITIDPFEGIILVDSEYIKYRGKLYYVASTKVDIKGYRIVFTHDEFNQLVANIPKGDSISFRGLVVNVRTKMVTSSNNEYIYQVVDDGRGYFKSGVAIHWAFSEDSDAVQESQRFKLMLGGIKSENDKVPGNLTATTKFNFLDKIRYKSGKKMLGTIPKEDLTSYLGLLHISGPNSSKEEENILLSILDAKKSQSVPEKLKKINNQVDDDVPGNFDDYVYLEGEKNIYGQKITLPFSPNAVSVRMRLYSPRRTIRNGQDIMSTNSSIAGVGFGLNDNNEGYFLEVESWGAGKDFEGGIEAMENNLRFYKVSLKTQDNGKTKYQPKLLLKTSVGGYTTLDTSLQIIKADNIDQDPVFDLDIQIEKYANGIVYSIFYGDTKIGDYTEPIGEAIGVNSNDIFVFVRNDSQALIEYIMAAARPVRNVITNKNKKEYFNSYKYFNRQLEKGIIPVNKSFIFKDDEIQFYFNDFARLAREVKEYDIRFTAPAYASALIDISKINPQYFVKKYEATSFGAKLVLVNSSSGPILLGEDSKLPIFITGIAVQEINTGTVSMIDYYDLIQDDKKRITEREKNIAIYGNQSFSLDSQFIQSIYHARGLMKWISKHCNRQRTKLSLEVFSNPLIELGDKVRVFDKSRGYYQDNPSFGSRTFVVSTITHNVSNGGPSMTIDLIEVGES